ncbi:hypothetical protein O181_006672 [Austropuccinia psidii MF-1]|uniref:Uncharacterized protein n=1 Tax=Austropuccinia psidii MF-1 TaxID=1389203 RepID=A0A9Q3BKG4_9BASI|nr:hypothetical protein [Austropuccinia psidii MF-1]
MANSVILSILRHGVAFWTYLLFTVIHGPRPQLWTPGHILHNWLPWPIFNTTNPQANTLVLALGGHLAFQGPLVPLTLSRAFGPPPLNRQTWVPNGRFGPFRPPTASTAMGPIPMWPKGEKGEDKYPQWQVGQLDPMFGQKH